MNSGECVFVAGGTGTAGRAYGRALKTQGYDVRATARDADGAAALAELGIEPVAVDLTDAEATADAIKGAMKVVVALLGRGEEAADQEDTITRNVIDAAARNGVEHLVYTSVYTAERPTDVPHFVVKDVLERYLAQAAVPATVLRPATFMDAFAAPWLREGLLGRGVLLSPIAIDAPISYIATADLADVAVGVLGDPDLLGATIEVGGPRPVTYRELLPLLSELVGHRVRYEQLPIEQVQAQFGSDVAAMVRLFNEEGFVVDPSPVVDRFGLQLTTVEEFLHQPSPRRPARPRPDRGHCARRQAWTCNFETAS